MDARRGEGGRSQGAGRPLSAAVGNAIVITDGIDLDDRYRRLDLRYAEEGTVTGTITQLHRDRGVGTILGDDRKSYTFRRSDVRDVWFHDLMEGATVAFEPGTHLSATRVRPVTASA
jgi:hypothetical protein